MTAIMDMVANLRSLSSAKIHSTGVLDVLEYLKEKSDEYEYGGGADKGDDFRSPNPATTLRPATKELPDSETQFS